MIQFQQVSKRFATKTALNNVTFAIPDKSFCVVKGPNGAGKSTSLKLIVGLMLPDSGSVTVASDRIGYVGHKSLMIPALSLYDNLAYQLGIYAKNHELNQYAQVFGIDQFWHQRVDTLSQGMLQRGCLARAFAIVPKLLVLDEPTTGLDVQSVEVLKNTIQSVHHDGTTVCLTSHQDAFKDLQTLQIQLAQGTAVNV